MTQILHVAAVLVVFGLTMVPDTYAQTTPAAAAPAAATPATPALRPKPCTSLSHRQFDFWIGN